MHGRFRLTTPGDENATRTPLLARRIRRSVVRVAFWSAVGLPLVYIPLLVGGMGVVNALALIAIHVIALVGGRGYQRPTA